MPVIRHNPRYSHVESRAADHSANIGSRLEQCAGNSRRLAELIPYFYKFTSKSAFRSSMSAYDSAIMMLSSEVSSVVFPAAREAYRDRSAAGLRATLRRRATRSRAARREILLPTARSVGKPPRG